MNLRKILFLIKKYLGIIEKRGFIINIKIDNRRVNFKNIALLYNLLNYYEDYYFITIENLPFCLMPDAQEHIVYNKDKKECYYDIICKNCKLQNCPGWIDLPNINRKLVQPPKDIPKEIVIEVTTKCNLNCKICTINKSEFLEVNFNSTKIILDEAYSLGIKAIRFTGGEPFLNKDIEKMLTYAKKRGFYVLLNTNATIINQRILNLLKYTVDNILISLQGFDKESDRVLTKSYTHFDKKITNIIRLKTVIPIVRIGTVISKILINNFDRYYKLFKKIKVDNWELYRPMIKTKDEEFIISKKDLLKTMNFILKLKKEGMKVKIANPVPFCISKNITLSLTTLLGAEADDGHSRIIWDPQGYFKPSYFIKENLGNTIKEAWLHPFLKKLRKVNYLPLRCQNCKYLKWCKGGSRVLAKLDKNDYFKVDPLV